MCSEWQDMSKNTLWGFSHDFLRVANFLGLSFSTWSPNWVAQQIWPCSCWPDSSMIKMCATLSIQPFIALSSYLYRQQPHQTSQATSAFIVWTSARCECEHQLNIAPTDIIAHGPTLWCDFCFRTAHSAALPVKPCWYASMNLQDWLRKHQMTSVGHMLRVSIAHFFASANFPL